MQDHSSSPGVIEPGPAWVEALAEGREPTWTPLMCGLLALIGWLGPRWLGLPEWVAGLAFVGSYLAGGVFSLVRSIKSLRRKQLDIDLLMLLSALGAASIGEYAEGAALLFLFSLSNALESRALHRTTNAIESLMELRPDEATLLEATGRERRVVADAIQAGEVVRVRPGERIPIDGHIRAGETSIDQSPITGESVHVEKGPGEQVFSGTINHGGTVDIGVDKPASESTLARIITLVEEAREAKAPTQRFIDRFEQGYAATVIFGAAAAVVIPLLLGEEFRATFYRAMTLLVVASPCAVVISTPATILAGLAHAARRGLLFKGGAPLEELANIDTIAFDKTGTLTTGRANVVEVMAFGDCDKGEILAYAAAVEQLSEHHLAHAIVQEAIHLGLEIPAASKLKNTRGQGATAFVGEQMIAVGRRLFVAEVIGLELDDGNAAAIERLQAQGRTLVFVGFDGSAGAIAIEDQIRPEAETAIRGLAAQGVHRTVLLTGDNKIVAAQVAAESGIDTVRAELLPEEKVDYIRQLTRRGEKVAMVGDGVNDAPALALSTVGIAMGVAGTDAALEVADLVLVRDRLDDLPYAVRLARRSLRIIRQNLAFACAVIAILVVTNLVHGLALPLGVIGHEGSTILVVLNGLRLLRPLPAD